MPTVVDELVVQLGLDSAQYRAATREFETSLTRTKTAANRTAKEMEADGKRAAEFFGQIKTEALSLIAVIGGGVGVTAAVRDATNSMAALGRAAQNVGATAPQLAQWQYVIERNGGSAAALTNSMQSLFATMQNIRTFGGGSQFFGFLGPIGGLPTDSPVQILMKYMRFIETHPGQTAFQNQIGRGLGIDQDTINALRQIGSSTELTRELTDALRDVPTEQQSRQSQQLQKDWFALQQAGKSLRNELVSDLTPAMDGLTKSMRDWIEANKSSIAQGTRDRMEKIGDAVKFAADQMGTWHGAAVTVAEYFAGPFLIATMAGLGPVAAVVAAIVAGLALIAKTRSGIAPESWPIGSPFWQGMSDREQGNYVNSPYTQAHAPWLRPRPVWWNPGTWLNNTSAQVGTPVPAAGTAAYGVMKEVHDFWASKGFSEDQIAGILANVAAESAFDPTRTGDNGTSYGLYQEHADRMRALFAQYGPSPSVAQQNEFAWQELNAPSRAGTLQALRGARNPGQAAAVWTGGFEVPQDSVNQAIVRAAAAPAFRAAEGTLHKTDIHINQVTVVTRATNANEVARGFADALATQANRGLIQ